MKIPYDSIIATANARKDALMAIESFVNDGRLATALAMVDDLDRAGEALRSMLDDLDEEGVNLLGKDNNSALHTLSLVVRHAHTQLISYRQRGTLEAMVEP